MTIKSNIDYIKIIVIGIVLFLLLYATLFLIGLEFLDTIKEKKIIPLLVSILLIIVYFISSIKHANSCNAITNNSNNNKATVNRNLNQWEMVVVFLFIIYFLISYGINIIYSKTVGNMLMMSSVIFIFIEIHIRKKRRKQEEPIGRTHR